MLNRGSSILISPSFNVPFLGVVLQMNLVTIYQQTELEAPIVSTKPRTDTQNKCTKSHSRFILGSKTVWKIMKYAPENNFKDVNTDSFKSAPSR